MKLSVEMLNVRFASAFSKSSGFSPSVLVRNEHYRKENMNLLMQSFQVNRNVPKRPPISKRDFLAQGLGGFAGLVCGAFSGLIIGGVIDGFTSPAMAPGQSLFFINDEPGMLLGFVGGMVIGPGVGVWLAGRTRTTSGSLALSVLGSIAGTIVGGVITVFSFGILSPLGALAPIGGAMGGFYLSRKWIAAPQEDLSFQSGPTLRFSLIDIRF